MIEIPDWTTADKALSREALRQAELRIESQVRFAVSADQRAAVLAAIYMAAGTAMIAGLVTSSNAAMAVLVGGSGAALFLVIGAVLCIKSILPITFHVAGNDPENWYDDIRENKDFVCAIGEALEYLQSDIGDNRDIMKQNARLFRWGALSGIGAPIIGVILWFLTLVCF